MRLILGVAAVLSLLCVSNAVARTRCGDGATDSTTVATVESAISTQCSCCMPRGAYARCVASVIKATVHAQQLASGCVTKVRRDVGHACPLVSTVAAPCTLCNADSDCGAGAFCQCRSGSCTKAGGVCTVIPPVCPDVIAPVCGCDGTTYGNDCLRLQAGACKLHNGPCVTSGGCFDTIENQCTGTACSPAETCPLPNEFCSPTCGSPPPTGTCFDTVTRKCTAQTCRADHPCLPNQFCVATCPPPPPAGYCFVTVDNQCSAESCGPDAPCRDPNEFCDPHCGPPACTTDTACDDGNACTADHCVNGACEHACVCVAPTGAPACCPGPATVCATPCGTNADGTCGGLCPAADEVCTATGTTCACTPMTPPACGDTFPTCNGTCPVGSTCTSLTGAPSCQCVPGCATDADCDDGNGCTADHCVTGTCVHDCVCLSPTGATACCPGPGTACVAPCGADAAGTCGGTCPVGATCETLPNTLGTCGCVSGIGGPCGSFVSPPPLVCAPGLVCKQDNPDVTGVCVASTCIPFFTAGCTQTTDCCQPCGAGVIAPCAVCIQGSCVGAP